MRGRATAALPLVLLLGLDWARLGMGPVACATPPPPAQANTAYRADRIVPSAEKAPPPPVWHRTPGKPKEWNPPSLSMSTSAGVAAMARVARAAPTAEDVYELALRCAAGLVMEHTLRESGAMLISKPLPG